MVIFIQVVIVYMAVGLWDFIHHKFIIKKSYSFWFHLFKWPIVWGAEFREAIRRKAEGE